jgi:hypothetical protein
VDYGDIPSAHALRTVLPLGAQLHDALSDLYDNRAPAVSSH